MTGSHVMQYGDIKIDAEEMELYLGFDPANENATSPDLLEAAPSNAQVHNIGMHIPQREADLLHLWHKVLKIEDLSQKLVLTFQYNHYDRCKVIS